MKTMVVLSGGLDSTVLLTHLKKQGDELLAITIDYGQRHKVEIVAAKHIAKRLGISHEIIDLSCLRRVMVGSSQTDQNIAVPYGHYAAESMKQTVVPNRNMILLAVAGAAAISQGAQAIAYAAHAGDHAIYPDCRPEFTTAMAMAFALANWQPLELLRPFVTMTKAQIVKRGAEIGAPMEMSYSCYEGAEEIHCGKCGTCVERREAFKQAHVKDPTRYDNTPTPCAMS